MESRAAGVVVSHRGTATAASVLRGVYGDSDRALVCEVQKQTRSDRTLVEDPLAWTLEQFEKGKLPAMIERAGYPGVAADLDIEKIASVFPAMKKQALAMWEEGQRLTGHPGLPLEPTPNLAAAD